MPETLTMEYNIENWIEATKDWSFIMYSPEGYKNMPNTMYIQDTSDTLHGTIESEHNSTKISRKQETFFGDNIRDAIRTIKG